MICKSFHNLLHKTHFSKINKTGQWEILVCTGLLVCK
uniref:Uncharacterized protein n=1 Tax=Rhizophora mucronata TaxID=61149 RepID=A0A2P2PDB5_RHIMU